jgi:hypothetical protein
MTYHDCVEWDTGAERVSSEDSDRTDIAGKFRSYWQADQRGLMEGRVLFVCKTDRIDNMIACAQSVVPECRKSTFFRFVLEAELNLGKPEALMDPDRPLVRTTSVGKPLVTLFPIRQPSAAVS